MARPKKAESLDNLRRQQADIAARLKAAEAAFAKALEEGLVRQQTLVGRVAIWLMNQEPDGEFTKTLKAAMDKRITKKADRALFDLPGREKEAAAPVEAVA